MELIKKISAKLIEAQSKTVMLECYSESLKNGQITQYHKQSVMNSMERACNQLEQIISELNELMDYSKPCSVIMCYHDNCVTIAEEVLI